MSLIKKIRPWEIVLIIFFIILILLRKIAGIGIVYLNELIIFIVFIVSFYLIVILPVLINVWLLYSIRNMLFVKTAVSNHNLTKKLWNKLFPFFRDFLPFVLIFAIYQTLGLGGDLIHIINPYDRDELLIALDQKLFGFQASVWAQQFIHPWLTEIMAFAYSLHIILPLIVAIVLYWNKKEYNFENYLLGVILVNCIGMLIYFIVPATFPHYYLQYDRPLVGDHIYKSIEYLSDNLRPTPRNTFPSLHVGLSAVVLLFSYKYSKRMFYLILVPVLLLWFSTIYLRRHYLIDVVAGWILAILCVYISPKINEWWLRTSR